MNGGEAAAVMPSREHSGAFGLLLVVAVLALHLWPEGTVRAYDWALHAAWIERHYQQLSAAVWWPQWLPDADGGRGSPAFLFYPPLTYWLAALFRGVTGDAVVALELTEATAIVLLYVGCLRLLRALGVGRIAAGWAVVACLSPAVLFVALRVHMVAATLALAAFPWLLQALLVAGAAPLRRSLMLAAALGLIGWTHLPSTVIALSLVAGGTAILLLGRQQPRRQLLVVALGGTLLGLAIALAALWPALAERALISAQNARLGALDWRSNFLFVHASEPGAFRADYAFLALAWLGAALCAVVGSIGAWRSTSDRRTTIRSSALLAITGLLLATPLAWPLYAALWPWQALQFPWRWLPIAALCALLPLALGTAGAPGAWRWLAAVALLTIAGALPILLGGGGPLPDRPRTGVDEARIAVASLHRETPEYRPRQLLQTHHSAELASPAPPPRTQFAEIAIQPLPAPVPGQDWQIDAAAAGAIEFGTACYPGWTAYRDGHPIGVGCSDRGLLQVQTAAGRYRLSLRFEPTGERLAARAVSAAAVLLWLLLSLHCIGAASPARTADR